jgi:hypothetical protein
LRFREFFVTTYRELKTYDHKYENEFLERIMKLSGVQF